MFSSLKKINQIKTLQINLCRNLSSNTKNENFKSKTKSNFKGYALGSVVIGFLGYRLLQDEENRSIFPIISAATKAKNLKGRREQLLEFFL